MKRSVMHWSAVALAASSLMAQSAGAADLVVPSGDAYFAGWTFNVSDNPRGCATANILPSTSSITGNLGPLTYEVHALGATTTTPPAQTVWLDCRWSTFAGNLPPGNNPPATVDTSHVRVGTYLHTFSAALPTGSLVLMQDFDGNESSVLTFRDCGGNAVDASGFDWLRVSEPTASVLIPNHTVGASWTVTQPAGASSNETTAIVVRSNEVCQIEVVNTKPGTGGGRHFFFAVPPVEMTVNVNVTGGPLAPFSGDHQLSLSCTRDGNDVSASITPASPVTVAAGTSPGAVTFQGIPVGAACTASLVQASPPAGFLWQSAPAPQTLTTGFASNAVTLNSPLNGATAKPVPTLGVWGLMLSAAALLGAASRRRRFRV